MGCFKVSNLFCLWFEWENLVKKGKLWQLQSIYHEKNNPKYKTEENVKVRGFMCKGDRGPVTVISLFNQEHERYKYTVSQNRFMYFVVQWSSNDVICDHQSLLMDTSWEDRGESSLQDLNSTCCQLNKWAILILHEPRKAWITQPFFRKLSSEESR